MKLLRLRAKNYRSLRDESIEFDDFNVFIGANASGKSTILDALRFLHEESTRATSRHRCFHEEASSILPGRARKHIRSDWQSPCRMVMSRSSGPSRSPRTDISSISRSVLNGSLAISPVGSAGGGWRNRLVVVNQHGQGS